MTELHRDNYLDNIIEDAHILKLRVPSKFYESRTQDAETAEMRTSLCAQSLENCSLVEVSFQLQGSSVVNLGDGVIMYHDDSKFYITTKQPNPQDTPQASMKITELTSIWCATTPAADLYRFAEGRRFRIKPWTIPISQGQNCRLASSIMPYSLNKLIQIS